MKQKILYLLVMAVIFGCTPKRSDQASENGSKLESDSVSELDSVGSRQTAPVLADSTKRVNKFIAWDPSIHDILDTLKIIDFGAVKETIDNNKSSSSYGKIRKVVLPYSSDKNDKVDEELVVNLVANGDSTISAYNSITKRPAYDIEVCFNHYKNHSHTEEPFYTCYTKKIVITREELFRCLKEKGNEEYWKHCMEYMELSKLYVDKMSDDIVSIFVNQNVPDSCDLIIYILQVDLGNENITILMLTYDGVFD